MDQPATHITQLLQRVGPEDHQALHAVMPLVYDELKRLAAGHLRREGKARLDTTELVHEAFLRLMRGQQPSFETRSHFFGIISRLMREVVVDLARAGATAKRNSGQAIRITDIPDPAIQPHRSLLAIDDAMKRLAHTDPLKVKLIEMRYFGGMTAEESAAMLSMSVHVVRRELRLAKAWLQREVAG